MPPDGNTRQHVEGMVMTRRHYLGIAEPGPSNWSISFPAFPGTVTTGDTVVELMAHASDALASVIEAMQEDGEAIPPDVESDERKDGPLDWSRYHDPRLILVPVDVDAKSVRINVTMDEGLVARVDDFATRARSSRSAVLARGARLVLASVYGDKRPT
jgi:predicted RNase H-like HicB family nuclease